MSSSGQLEATTHTSNFQSIIIDALADYANQTGIDLSQNPFAERLQQSKTSDSILELLQEREKAFEEYRNGDRRLVNCLSLAVRVLHGFSGLLSQAIGIVSHICIIPFECFHIDVLIQPYQVPFPPANAVFVGIDVLLTVCTF
jgi:fungal STAND N-terminal Goodbye domain